MPCAFQLNSPLQEQRAAVCCARSQRCAVRKAQRPARCGGGASGAARGEAEASVTCDGISMGAAAIKRDYFGKRGTVTARVLPRPYILTKRVLLLARLPFSPTTNSSPQASVPSTLVPPSCPLLPCFLRWPTPPAPYPRLMVCTTWSRPQLNSPKPPLSTSMARAFAQTLASSLPSASATLPPLLHPLRGGSSLRRRPRQSTRL